MDRQMLDGKQDPTQERESATTTSQQLDAFTAQYIHARVNPLEARVDRIGSVITRARQKVQESRVAIRRSQQNAGVAVARLKQLVSSPPGWFLNVCQNDAIIPLFPTFPADDECKEVRDAACEAMSIQFSVQQTTLPLTLTIKELVLQEVLEGQAVVAVGDIQEISRVSSVIVTRRELEENSRPAATDSAASVVSSSDCEPGEQSGLDEALHLSGAQDVGHARTLPFHCTESYAGTSETRMQASNSSTASEMTCSLPAPVLVAKTSDHASVSPRPELTDLRKFVSVADARCTCSQHRSRNEPISDPIKFRRTPFTDQLGHLAGLGDCGPRDARSDRRGPNTNHHGLKDGQHNDEERDQNTVDNPNSVHLLSPQQARTQVESGLFKHLLPETDGTSSQTLHHGKLQDRRALNQGSESENSLEDRQQQPRDPRHVGTYVLQKKLLHTKHPAIECGGRLPDEADDRQIRACVNRPPRHVVARTCSSAQVTETSETRVCVRGTYTCEATQEQQLPFLVFVFVERDEDRPQFLRLSGSYVRKMLTRPKNLRWRFTEQLQANEY